VEDRRGADRHISGLRLASSRVVHVGGLSVRMNTNLVEPFRQLFKLFQCASEIC
jgi:hypothetical protein